MLWYSLEAPPQGTSNEYHNILSRNEINIHTFRLLIEKGILSKTKLKTEQILLTTWLCVPKKRKLKAKLSCP